MPVGSIPPVERGLVKGQGASRPRISVRASVSSRTTTAVRASAGPRNTAISRGSASSRTSASRPIPRESSPPMVLSPSIHDVKIRKTANGTTWEFPYGEFEVMIEKGEVHIELKIGRFVDALILELGNKEVIT